MPDYSEVQAELDRRDQGQSADPRTVLDAHARGSHMVALKLEELLASDEWNTFIAHLKALQEADQAEAEGWRRRLEHPGMLPDEILLSHQQLQRVLGRLEARQVALDLPREIIARDAKVQAAYAKKLDNSD